MLCTIGLLHGGGTCRLPVTADMVARAGEVDNEGGWGAAGKIMGTHALCKQAQQQFWFGRLFVWVVLRTCFVMTGDFVDDWGFCWRNKPNHTEPIHHRLDHHSSSEWGADLFIVYCLLASSVLLHALLGVVC